MSGDEGNLASSERASHASECASCGAERDSADVRGAEIPVATSGTPNASDGVAKSCGPWPKFIGATLVALVVCLVSWVVFCGPSTHGAEDMQTIVLPGNVNMEFVWCPPGTFTMGSPEGELGRDPAEDSDEVQHEVTLSQGFWMARYPTTQSQYKALMGSNPAEYDGDDRPVEKVSWNDAVAFCEKVNEQLGSALPEGFRCMLPTEAQWEYACRAGTTSALNSGRELTNAQGSCPNLDAVAWYDANSDDETHAVGQKQANAWGLYDMHGNVSELCRDWCGSYPTGSVTDPTGPENGSARVNRGGASSLSASGCRSAFRGGQPPNVCGNQIGFRVVLAR